MSIVVGADGIAIRMERAERYRAVEVDVLIVGVESTKLGVAGKRVI